MIDLEWCKCFATKCYKASPGGESKELCINSAYCLLYRVTLANYRTGWQSNEPITFAMDAKRGKHVFSWFVDEIAPDLLIHLFSFPIESTRCSPGSLPFVFSYARGSMCIRRNLKETVLWSIITKTEWENETCRLIQLGLSAHHNKNLVR